MHRVRTFHILANLRLGEDSQGAESELSPVCLSAQKFAFAAAAVQGPAVVLSLLCAAGPWRGLKRRESLGAREATSTDGNIVSSELSSKNKHLVFLKSFIFDKCLSLAFV